MPTPKKTFYVNTDSESSGKLPSNSMGASETHMHKHKLRHNNKTDFRSNNLATAKSFKFSKTCSIRDENIYFNKTQRRPPIISYADNW